ncbi:MAG: hypothetical protein Q8P13_02910 [bacterium]|nr:hypothetical protein [bacterium]
MDSINLLPQVAETEIKKDVYKRKISVAAVASLLAVAGIIIALFGYQLFLSARDRTLTAETTEKTAQITSPENAALEVKQRALIGKLEAITGYLNSNKSTARAFKQIITLASSGQVSLSRVELSSAGAITVAGFASTSSNLGRFFDNLTDEKATVSLEKVVASSVSLTSNSYQFTVRLNYTKPGLLDREEKTP